MLAGQPVHKRIELLEFSPDAGAKFLVHSTRGRIIIEHDPQYLSASKVSIRLSGHALALSQMVAPIQLTPPGYRARHLYGLARGQAALPRTVEASKQTLLVAIKTAANPKLNLANASWEVFDSLVRIVER